MTYGGAKSNEDQAWVAFRVLRATLEKLGLEEAAEKACPPSTKMEWLGITFDSVKQIISLDPRRIKEVLDLVATWEGKTQCTITELKSLLGKLQHVCKVCKPARAFINRLLNMLREKKGKRNIVIGPEAKEDLKFFAKLLPHYNGVHVLKKSFFLVLKNFWFYSMSASYGDRILIHTILFFALI